MSIIIGGLLAGAFTYTMVKTDQSIKLDAKAAKRLSKSFDRETEANDLIHEKRQQADNALMKVANRKRAILSTSMNDFLQLYERIIKIDFVEREGMIELKGNLLIPARLEQLQLMTNISISPMSEKELVNTFLIEGFKGFLVGGVIGAVATGVGGAMVKESENNLSQANNHLRIAEVAYSQAETASTALEAITTRSNKIAELLAKMNLLFTRSVKMSGEIIEINGIDRVRYSLADRETLMTSINLADAIKKIIDAPLLDKEGAITQDSFSALQTGNEYLQKLQRKMEER